MPIRSFTGYLNTGLFGSANPFNGATFTLPQAAFLEILMSDGFGDTVVEGDSNGGSGSTESSEDPESDQFLYSRDQNGTVVANGREFYLESQFEFTIGGLTFTGYHFEDETGQDFTILPPDVPSGTATVTSVSYVPNPDEVDYDALSSGNEAIDADFYSALSLVGGDSILGGAGDDTIEAGIGDDTVQGAGGEDTIYGDVIYTLNGTFQSDQADNSWSAGSVEGWYNDGSGGVIERWGQGFQGLFTDDGSTFIELDANSSGGIDHVQTDLDLDEGVFYVITIDHAARASGGTNDDFFITHNGVSQIEVSPASTGYFTTTSIIIEGQAGVDTIGFLEKAGQNDSLGILLTNFTVSLAESEVASGSDSYSDLIDGGADADVIYGQEGDDTITGGDGDDFISGGIGADSIVVTDGGGTDIISDFDITQDQLDVSGLMNADGLATTTADVTVTSDGQGGSILTFSNGEQIILRGVATGDVDTPAELQDIGIPCFTNGTRIETKRGHLAVEELVPGDMIRVQSGYAALRLNLTRAVSAQEMITNPKLVPVRICAGALGQGLPVRDLRVSRQHRMLVQSKVAMRMFDTMSVLVAAIRLIDLPGIDLETVPSRVAYHHLVFDKHQIVFAEGAPSESFLIAPEGIRALSDDAREELFTLFPAIQNEELAFNPAVLVPCNKKQKELIGRHLKNRKAPLQSAPLFDPPSLVN